MAHRNKHKYPTVTLSEETASMVSEHYTNEVEEEVGDDLGIEIGHSGLVARPNDEAGLDPQLRLNPRELTGDGQISQKDRRNDLSLQDLDERTRNLEEEMD